MDEILQQLKEKEKEYGSLAVIYALLSYVSETVDFCYDPDEEIEKSK